MRCLCIDIGEVRKIIFSLSLCPVVKEYGIAVRLPPGCHNVSGRCWMWLSGSWVCYATMVLHWPLRTMKQNDAQYNRRNHRCCKPCLCQVPTLWQCSIPDGGHRSCSLLNVNKGIISVFSLNVFLLSVTRINQWLILVATYGICLEQICKHRQNLFEYFKYWF